MEYIADLHIHSPYSRATSKGSTLAGLAAWGRIKGIQLLGSGDATHPAWFSHLQEELVPAEPGFFRLRNEDFPPALPGVIPTDAPIRFMLSAEVSCIYKRHGKVRKVHSLLYFPDFPSAERMNKRLAAIGNIKSDGRPILGVDARDLLEILLHEAPDGFMVPAHIWTPWFSLFGSKSGFDSIEECFADLSHHIFALETGLSSDPAMNRLVSSLDRFALISNSDCHSPQKLGREANLFATGFDYFSLRDALRGNRRQNFRGTIEFFPEEGKYHADGHRQCQVCLDPEETRRHGLRCPVCGGLLTVGVQHRVLDLADRTIPEYDEQSPEFWSLVPLPELLAELLRVGSSSKEVLRHYGRIIGHFGSEFQLLLKAPLDEITHFHPLLAEAVGRMRRGEVIRQPGYDGEFGRITLFTGGELERLAAQGERFGDDQPRRGRGGVRAVKEVRP
ncbi:MAG TPA: endonuclease Q family protein [Geobacterales bacterium]|nr:endonuclease Q family protein [Geobacterales bacterium]